jgi:hypothetical protein
MYKLSFHQGIRRSSYTSSCLLPYPWPGPSLVSRVKPNIGTYREHHHWAFNVAKDTPANHFSHLLLPKEEHFVQSENRQPLMQVLILHNGLLIENPDLALAPRDSHCSGTITDKMDASHAKMGPLADRWHEPLSMEMHPRSYSRMVRLCMQTKRWGEICLTQ